MQSMRPNNDDDDCTVLRHLVREWAAVRRPRLPSRLDLPVCHRDIDEVARLSLVHESSPFAPCPGDLSPPLTSTLHTTQPSSHALLFNTYCKLLTT